MTDRTNDGADGVTMRLVGVGVGDVGPHNHERSYPHGVPRRRPGILLALEEDILELAMRREREGRLEFYGFALAEDLGSADDVGRLLGHGTLYKALNRLEASGLLESRWEDVDSSQEGRPPRRLYRLTGLAEPALARSRAAKAEATAATGDRPRWAVT